MTIHCHRCGQAVTQTSLMCCGVQYGLNGNAVEPVVDPELRQLIQAVARWEDVHTDAVFAANAQLPGLPQAFVKHLTPGQLLPQVCRLYQADVDELKKKLGQAVDRAYQYRRRLDQVEQLLERVREAVDDA